MSLGGLKFDTLYPPLTTFMVFFSGTGIAYITQANMLLGNYTMVGFGATIALINTLLAILIVCRIRYLQNQVKATMGPAYSSTYSSLIQFFIESAAMIVLFNVAHAALAPWPNHAWILAHQLLVHVHVRSL